MLWEIVKFLGRLVYMTFLYLLAIALVVIGDWSIRKDVFNFDSFKDDVHYILTGKRPWL